MPTGKRMGQLEISREEHSRSRQYMSNTCYH